MTPPSSLFNRRPVAPDRDWPAAGVVRPPAPDLSVAARAYRDSLSGFSTSGRDILLRAAGPNSENRLAEGIVACERQARAGNVRLYPTVLRLRSTQFANAASAEERASAQEGSRMWAEEALSAILGSSLPVADRAWLLYETAVTLSAILTPESAGTPLPDEDRELILSYFIHIRALLDPSSGVSDATALPDYLLSYAQAQEALLQKPPQPRAAFQLFLEARRQLAETPGHEELRTRLAASTEAALLNFPRATHAVQRENLRTYYSLYALLLFDQVDGGDPEIAEELLTAAAERLQGDERCSEARPLLQSLADDASLSESLRRNAQRLLDAAAAPPYRAILERDAEHRNFSSMVAALESSAPLRQALVAALRAPQDAGSHDLALLLSEYGAVGEDLLASLPNSLLQSPAGRELQRSYRPFADDAVGTRLSLEIPLEEIIESLVGMSEREDRYAPAFAQIFRDMSEGPTAGNLPPDVRQAAEAALHRLSDFDPGRILRHLTSSESLLTLAAGIAMTELAPIALLRYARNGGLLVRGGRLTWQAELASGIGIGFATSSLGAIHHLSASPRPMLEEVSEMWPAFAINTLSGGLAMGGTMLAGRGLRHWLLPEGVATQLGLRSLALRGGTFLGGGTMMLGANALGESALTGAWRTPSAEEAVETYATMALWDLGAAGLRQVGHRYWWRAQLGPHRMASEFHPLLRALDQRNPWLAQGAAERRALENYIGRRVAEGRDLEPIYRGFAENHEPNWSEGRLIFRSTESAPNFGEAGELLAPTEWLSLTRMPMPDHAMEILLDPRFRPVARVEAGRRVFYLSRVLRAMEDGQERRFVLALTPVVENGVTQLRHRFFYQSGSDVGAWRGSPATLGNGHILKGPRHYTQDTQVVPELLEAITAMDASRSHHFRVPREELNPYITLGDAQAAIRMSNIGRFNRELEFPAVQGLSNVRAMQPGAAFAEPRHPIGDWPTALGNAPAEISAAELIERLSDISYPRGFVPDFTARPRRIFQVSESLLGPVTFREYAGGYLVQSGGERSRPILWVMGEDARGRAWVKSIRYADTEVNSFGLYQEVIDSGILTSKPLEYHEQSRALPPEYRPRFNDTYADITPALSLLQPIREYMAARNLPPREPQ